MLKQQIFGTNLRALTGENRNQVPHFEGFTARTSKLAKTHHHKQHLEWFRTILSKCALTEHKKMLLFADGTKEKIRNLEKKLDKGILCSQISENPYR